MDQTQEGQKMSSDYFFTETSGKKSDSSFTTRLRRIMPLVVAGVGVILMVAGLLINYYKTNQTTVSDQVATSASSVSGDDFSHKIILVDIGGAVERPGVIETSNDSRIQDVLISAGGLSAKADRIYICKNINLAQRVFDGMKLYFPFEGEVVDSSRGVVKSTSSTNGNVIGGVGTLININAGSQAELESLPGVGPVTAGKIIAGRPYQTISDLIDRKVVGKSVFEKIKELISLN